MPDFYTLLLGGSGLTGKSVLQQMLSLPSYFPVIDVPTLTSNLELNHHIIIITRSQFDLGTEVEKISSMFQKSDLVEWKCVFNESSNTISYSTTIHDLISICVNVEVTTIKEPDSTKWAQMIPHHIFINDPSADLSVISCLGSTSARSKRTGVARDWVDKILNLDILKAILNNDILSQKLSQYIIMTSFNNFAISRMFPYFKAKQELETNTQFLLQNHRASIVILRPGPLIGKHGSTSSFTVPELDDRLLHSILRYKKAIFHHYVRRMNEWKDVGIATRTSELMAQFSYNMPGAFFVGYPVKVLDCAHVIVTERMKHFKLPSLQPQKVTYFSSQQIDSYKAKNEIAHIY